MLMFCVAFSACNPDKNNLSIFDVNIEYDNLQDYSKAELYKIFLFDSQKQLDAFCETHPVLCSPTVDFTQQCLLIVWGMTGGNCVGKNAKLVKNGDRDYILKLSITANLMDSTDHIWSYSCVTNRKPRIDETISLDILVQNQDETNGFIPISVFPVDYHYCNTHFRQDTLYRIYTQDDMNNFFQGYPYHLPKIDFSKQTLFLVYGQTFGQITGGAIRLRKHTDNLYDLGVRIIETPSLIGGDPWAAAFWTYHKIDETDSINLTINN
jgi:hypothetical protein